MEELTPELNYRFTIIEAIDFCNQTKKDLFVRLVNVAMAGEYSDSNFEEGDEIPSDISYFINCEDKNVQTLVKFLQRTDYMIDFLMSINNIKEDELGIKVE